MSIYIRETGGGNQIITDRQIRKAFPNVSFPRPLPLEALAARNVYPLVNTAQPSYDPATQKVVPDEPVRVGDTYEKRWSVVALTQDEIDAIEAETAQSQAIDAIKNDNQVKALLLATPTQINNYIDNNVDNLASAKTILKILARAVAVVANGTLRD